MRFAPQSHRDHWLMGAVVDATYTAKRVWVQAMSAPPWMAFYPADYLRDTLHLTAEDHGAYLLLLLAMWNAGGRLPDASEDLQRIARVPTGRWPKVWDRISKLMIRSDGFVTHKRLSRELAKATATSERQRQNVGQRWAKARGDDGYHGNTTDIPARLVVPSDRSVEASPSSEAIQDKNLSGGTSRTEKVVRLRE